MAKFNLSEVFEERHSSAPPNFVMKAWRCAEDLGVRRRASPRGSGFWRGTRSIHTRSSTWGAQPRLLEAEASFNRAQPLHKVSLDTENGGTFGPQELTMMATAHGRQSRDEPGNKIPGRRPESTCPRSGSYARPPPRALDGWQPRLPQRRPPAADLSDEDFAQSLLTCASDCVAHSPSTAARRAGLTQARPIDYDGGFPRSGRTTSMAADSPAPLRVAVHTLALVIGSCKTSEYTCHPSLRQLVRQRRNSLCTASAPLGRGLCKVESIYVPPAAILDSSLAVARRAVFPFLPLGLSTK